MSSLNFKDYVKVVTTYAVIAAGCSTLGVLFSGCSNSKGNLETKIQEPSRIIQTNYHTPSKQTTYTPSN